MPLTIAVAASSQALTLTPIETNPVTFRPDWSPGHNFATVTGTITQTVAGETIDLLLLAPFNANGEALIGGGKLYTDQINASLLSTGTYTGPIFERYIDVNSNVGYFAYRAGGNDPVLFRIFSSVGEPTIEQTYSITVTPVPEPASLAALGLGALGLLRRKRR